ncbi:unnamed protein product [Parajaminaea phylloscopi]
MAAARAVAQCGVRPRSASHCEVQLERRTITSRLSQTSLSQGQAMARQDDRDYGRDSRSGERYSRDRRDRDRYDESRDDYSGRKHRSSDGTSARGGTSYARDREQSPTSSRYSPPPSSRSASSHRYDDYADSRRSASSSRWDQPRHDAYRDTKRKRDLNESAHEGKSRRYERDHAPRDGRRSRSPRSPQSRPTNGDTREPPARSIQSVAAAGFASLPSKPAFLPASTASSAAQSPALDSPTTPLTPSANAEDDKMRAKRERLEAWRKEREAKKALEEAKLRAQSVAAAHSAAAPAPSASLLKGSSTTTIDASRLKGLATRNEALRKKGSTSTSAMDDAADQPAKRQLKRLNLPPVDPLLKPGAGGKVGSGSDMEGDDADDDDDDGSDQVVDPKDVTNASQMELDGDEEEEDPLDAFMNTVQSEVKVVDAKDLKRLGVTASRIKAPVMGQDEDEAPTNGTAEGRDDLDELDKAGAEDILALAAKKIKKKEMPTVDHSKVDYEPFQKEFYHSPTDGEEMTEEDAERLRMELDAIKVRGKDCPKPLTRWSACGLPANCLDVIKKLEYKAPTPIQSQAIPAIMAGRDIIGVAKTGSGKTMAFLLPMFRHIKAQRPVEKMEGPIGLIMTPTRELAVQIYRESRPFLKATGLRAVCVYGGAPISEQIAEMKKTADIVVATPGRMIDLLTANQGRVTNLRRVTYLVLDEADRMFDMGFEPQVMKIVNNVRPDRQTVLFSATFPKQMESLARKVLRNKPVEITVGGRSVVAAEIEQIVEVREEETKFNRLLEILGQTYNTDENVRTLIFVDRQEAADDLLKDLIRKGYMTMSLHGGKDQVDRDATISDFKAGIVPIVTATSVAARGLDVKQLKLVINYDAPNHMEDYVHRAGRTGRAGNKGTCVTFITPSQDRYARDIIAALKASKVSVPSELQALADSFQEMVSAGKAQAASSGFGGKGLERLESDREKTLRAQRSAYGEGDDTEAPNGATADGEKTKDLEIKVQRGPPPSDDQLSGVRDFHIEVKKGAAPESIRENKVGAGEDSQKPATPAPPQENANAAAIAAAKASGADAGKLAQVLAKINALAQEKKAQRAQEQESRERKPKDPDATDFHAIVPINDFPQKARWRCTNKETMSTLIAESGASITNKGVFYEKGKEPSAGEPPKLQLLIESNDEEKVENAVRAIKQILLEATQAALEAEQRNSSTAPGRYNVV